MPTAAERREHDVSARALLAIEAATADALRETLDSLPRDPADAEREARDRLTTVFLSARRAARSQGRRRLDAELEQTLDEARRFGVRSSFGLTVLPRPDVSDLKAAQDAAAQAASELRRRADADGVRRAAAASGRRLNASAQVLTADAWADERDRVLRASAREQSGSDVLPLLGRLWDARLDACPVCRRLDGTIRPIGVGFPGDAVAGKIHHSCRCLSPVFFSPIYLGRSAA
jgi:hypothetical protein